jgi:predicted nuclease of predicted toxin-antitoxin system
MWLLDVNLPTRLTELLRGYGIHAETTAARGWRALTNGELARAAARAAARAGFTVVLTRDRAFGAAAGLALQDLSDLAIVIVTLRQAREAAYLSAFDIAWSRQRIEPTRGAVIEWP